MVIKTIYGGRCHIILCGNSRPPMLCFQLIKPLIKGTFPTFIIVDTYLRDYGPAIFQMATRKIGHLNFQPRIRPVGCFASHAEPPLLGVMPIYIFPAHFLLLILMSKKDAINEGVAHHFLTIWNY